MLCLPPSYAFFLRGMLILFVFLLALALYLYGCCCFLLFSSRNNLQNGRGIFAWWGGDELSVFPNNGDITSVWLVALVSVVPLVRCCFLPQRKLLGFGLSPLLRVLVRL